MEDKINFEETRLWSLLIPRIEDILGSDIKSEYKCWIIERLIKNERDR